VSPRVGELSLGGWDGVTLLNGHFSSGMGRRLTRIGVANVGQGPLGKNVRRNALRGIHYKKNI